MSGARRPSIDDVAERLLADPLDPGALRALLDEIGVAADRYAHRFRAFGRRERDDVHAEVVKAYWTRISGRTLPREGLVGQIHKAVYHRFVDRWRRVQREPVPASGRVGAEASPLDGRGEETILTFDPLESLRLAYATALARRQVAARPHLERAWRRYWRVIDEQRPLTEIVREEEGGAGAVAATRAHARMVGAVLDAAPEDERPLLRSLLHLRAVSDPTESGRPAGGEGDP